MVTWVLKERDLKKYPHFDPLISTKDAEALATDPDRVKSHAFFPFMRYQQRWTRFSEKGTKGKSKDRPIRYAARSDAYIYTRYRHMLSELYEAELLRLNISQNVLAYRRILDERTGGGKCNIHFTFDAVNKIRAAGNCYVIALDISSYFESLDHLKLKNLWCRMLGLERLPEDHFKVFQAITKYSVADKERVYERLGHYGHKRTSKLGNKINGYLTPYNKVPKKLCDGTEFRKKIAGGSALPSLIEKNYKPYGIPQGAPISDLLANLYLIDFDRLVADAVTGSGGFYCRYSDDILIVSPGDEDAGRGMLARIQTLIKDFGAKLRIKDEKSSLFIFEILGGQQRFRLIQGTQGKAGLEYLGFRYDGQHVYLRDSTLSNLYRRVVSAARRDANALARKHPDKNYDELSKLFNFERLIKEFGRVEDFNEKQEDYRKWTFWTYATRASEIFGPIGSPILRQLKRHRQNIRRRASAELAAAVVRRDKLSV